MPSESLYREILKWQHLEYAACDVACRVYDYSPGLVRLCKRISGPVRGQKLEDLFDELAGTETDLDQILRGAAPALTLEKVRRQFPDGSEGYVTLTVGPFGQGFLLVIKDVTAESQLEQRVTQQRNDLDLLAGQLAAAHSQLDDLFHRFAPVAVADRAVAHPAAVHFGGDQRLVTALFADMRGYNTLANVETPQVVMELLSQHFGIIGQTVAAHGGSLYQALGLGALALFNTPDDQPDHAQQAVSAGLELQEALQSMREQPADSVFGHIADFGVGINTGPMIAGYVAVDNHFDHTVLGEAANLAAQLARLARAGQVLVGPQTRAAVQEYFQTLPASPVLLKDQDPPVLSYEAVRRYL
jgi:adenylate cyclase